MTSALIQAKALYQVAPIVLVNGIASGMLGGTLSILSLIMPGMLLNNVTIDNMDQAFGAFNVYPGGTLSDQTVPMYPLADMTMAANAIVRNPINVSLIWDAPMRGLNAFATKLTTMQALKSMLDQHNNLGGLYHIMTPAFLYDNCILTALTDNSRGTGSLPQNAWRFDFVRPMVVTLTDLTSAYNTLMGKIAGGLTTNGQWTTPALTPGSNLPQIPGLNTPAPISPFNMGTPTTTPNQTITPSINPSDPLGGSVTAAPLQPY